MYISIYVTNELVDKINEIITFANKHNITKTIEWSKCTKELDEWVTQLKQQLNKKQNEYKEYMDKRTALKTIKHAVLFEGLLTDDGMTLNETYFKIVQVVDGNNFELNKKVLNIYHTNVNILQKDIMEHKKIINKIKRTKNRIEKLK